jgi:hypothetical protein
MEAFLARARDFMSNRFIPGMVAIVSLLAVAQLSRADTLYSLSTDWSNTSNPNGVWSYNQGSSPLASHQTNWAGTGGDGWTTSTSGINPPAWLQQNGSPVLPNLAIGDVFVHSSNGSDANANVTWTSPASGTIDISGQAWDVEHQTGRDDAWTLSLNNIPIAFRGSIVGVAKNSAAANFANNPIPHSLNNLLVSTGDVVRFEIHETTGQAGHFSGVDLNIDLAPSAAAPLPGAATAGMALMSVLGGTKWLRRRNTIAEGGHSC